MAHIKNNPNKGHREGDQIFNSRTNTLYVLKKDKSGTLRWRYGKGETKRSLGIAKSFGRDAWWPFGTPESRYKSWSSKQDGHSGIYMGEGGALFTESGASFKRDPKDTRNVYMIVNDFEQGRAIENEAKFNRVDVRYQSYNKEQARYKEKLDKYAKSTGITTDQLLGKDFLTERYAGPKGMGSKYRYTYIHNNKEYTVPQNIIGTINDYRAFEAKKNKIKTNNPKLANRLTINNPAQQTTTNKSKPVQPEVKTIDFTGDNPFLSSSTPKNSNEMISTAGDALKIQKDKKPSDQLKISTV